MMALAVVSETELVASLPRRLVETHAARFGVITSALPLSYPHSTVRVVATKAAMMDAGIAWLVDTLEQVSRTSRAKSPPRRKRRAA
jgi:DNA-binding transcriptional LysR family regulator